MGIKEKYRNRPPLPADWAERLRRLPRLLARHDVRLAYLFGSAVTGWDGHARGEVPGDIDLAYLPGPGFHFRPFYAAASKALGTDRLELIDLRRAAPGLVFEIISRGRVIHRDRVETENAFELAALGRFRDEAVRLARWAEMARS